MQFIMGFEKTYLWEDPIQSGIVFGSVLVTLISICYYSLISVVAYCSLTALLAVLSLKIYTYVMVTFLKKETANPLAKCSGKYMIVLLWFHEFFLLYVLDLHFSEQTFIAVSLKMATYEIFLKNYYHYFF